MPTTRHAFTTPRLAPLRWLTDPGRHVPVEIRVLLLGELFAAPKAVVAGVLSGLILNVAALAMHEGWVFACFIVLDLALATLRIHVGHRAIANAARGLPTPTDLYLLSASTWCALQGAMAFAATSSGNATLELLGASTAIGLVGPICARNYAAPRYAILLVCLCILPFVSAAALSGDPWMLILVAQTPLFLFGAAAVIARVQRMAVATLEAEHDSRRHARLDALTGLLNRFGLMERLDAEYGFGRSDFIVFYLDLDGFKAINDSFGHPVGDQILCAVADRLQATVRATDLVSRLGGDEFVVVARDMSATSGGDLAEAVIQAVGGQPFLLPGLPPLRVGISVGFACSPEDGSNWGDLHDKADLALYEAKRAGRGIYRRFKLSASSIGGPEPGLPRPGSRQTSSMDRACF